MNNVSNLVNVCRPCLEASEKTENYRIGSVKIEEFAVQNDQFVYFYLKFSQFEIIENHDLKLVFSNGWVSE